MNDVSRFSFSRSRNRFAALGLGLAMAFSAVGTGFLNTPVQAGSVDSARRKVQQIVDQIEAAEEEADRLSEELRSTEDDKARLEEEIAVTLADIEAKKVELSGVEAEMSDLAIEAFVGGGRTGSLTGLLSPGGGPNESIQRQYLTEIALNVAFGNSDKLDALITDLNDLQKKLERDRKRASELADRLVSDQAKAEIKISEYLQLKAKAVKELGNQIAEERARREAEAAARARTQAGQVTSPSSRSAFNPDSVPPSSSRGAIAVAAARSQIGVMYKYATAIEGVSFDCSGLTMWAWRQAGVSLPHQSRLQFQASPKVPLAYLEPGDLVFFYTPITHVGIYVGDGLMIDAPGVGREVRLTAVTWSKVVGATRPG